VTIATTRAYEAERRRLTRHRAIAASILGTVLVLLFGIVDYFMFRPHFPALMGTRVISSLTSAMILVLLRRPFGRRHPFALAIALALEVGLAIAGIPVWLTGANTPYVSISLLILSLAALFPWTRTQAACLSAALTGLFIAGAMLHGVPDPGAFLMQLSAIVVTGVIAVVITDVSERMRSREFAARRALHAASHEKTRLVHDLAQKTSALEILNQELQTVNQEMEDLLYVASHDLRAPLINIEGFTNELRLGLSDLRQHTNGGPDANAVCTDLGESLGFIQSAIRRMDGLISGLLNVSRIATRTNPTEDVHLQAVVEKIIESFRYQLDQQHIHATIGRLPTVRGDAIRLNQVFSNLIDNAIKYMGHGASRSIEIGTHNSNGMPRFFVKDSGPGIPVESQDTVFRLFRRLATGVPGEGLGLTMVRKIVEKHGGRIWIESAPGHGTTFWFTLPGPAYRDRVET
jgi:signal transduction histidine kinase